MLTIIEKSADEMDMASEMEATFNEAAQAAVVARLLPQHDPNFNGVNCLDCDELLAPLRLFDRRIRCVPCQGRVERRMKNYGSN